ncbi:MAG: phytanoyl-CoA dioxygenase [Citrobacter freundii]|nr:MAG: phytanoyl-CoA dioxygenase [Citrobacter freundii]
MMKNKEKLEEDGFVIVDKIFSSDEVRVLKELLQAVDGSNPSFRKTEDLFAIRRLLIEVMEAKKYVLNEALKTLVRSLFGEAYFIVKSIYFDKPGSSNWFVSYHQDLTISVNRKADIPGFGPWTTKQDLFAVQPPLEVLENIYTIRIHLDDTDENNGALRVVPGSHKRGIVRPEAIDWNKETEIACRVPAGGIMIMKPLLLHASSRTISQSRRRVIHIEFSDHSLPAPLEWAEKLPLSSIT